MTKEGDVDFEAIESEEEDENTDYSSYKIIAYGLDMTVETLIKKLNDGERVIPPFQRKFVWTVKKASKLIESFLLGLPVPQIFLYKEEESQDLLVVDGQQRLKSIKYFFDGKWKDGSVFKLRDVHSKWSGKSFEGLSEAERRKLKNGPLRAIMFEQTNPQDNSSVFEIFERLNTGGVTLTSQEIRNCVIRDNNIGAFLDELNKNDTWRELLGKSEPDSRMKDVEMILRFFALYEDLETYSKPMKEFLTKFMKKNKKLTDERKETFTSLFTSVIDKIYQDIGIVAFRKPGSNSINAAIVDSLCVGVAQIGPENLKDLKKKHTQLVSDPTYLDLVTKSTTDPAKVNLRVSIVVEKLSQ
jgi:hypothetical protein